MSRYGTVGGIVASSSDAYYVDHSDNRDRLSPAASANLLAQNAALIAGTVSGIEGAVSPINQHGAIASFTAATFALSTEIDVFKEDVDKVDDSKSNSDRLTNIMTVLGDVFTGLGNVVQILDSASEFDPALKPISALAEGYANILEIGGLTLTDPELVRETLAAGADAAATGVKNLIGEASTAIKGLFSAAKDSPDTSTGIVSDLDHMSSFALSAIAKIDNGNSNINAQAFEKIVNSVDGSAQNEFFNYIPTSAEIGESQVGTSDAAVLTSDGLHASGRLVFKDNGAVADLINLQDGTSQAVAVNLNGSVVTSDYAGAGGTGGLIEREINFQNGTSEVIVPNEIGGYETTHYGGTDGAGSIVSTTGGGTTDTTGGSTTIEDFTYTGSPFTQPSYQDPSSIGADVYVANYTPGFSGTITNTYSATQPYIAAWSVEDGNSKSIAQETNDNATGNFTLQINNNSVTAWDFSVSSVLNQDPETLAIKSSNYSGDSDLYTYGGQFSGQNADSTSAIGSWSPGSVLPSFVNPPYLHVSHT